MRLKKSFVIYILFSAACSRKEPVVHDVVVAPTSAPSVSAAAEVVDAGSGEVAKVSAWTDAPIVEKLQTDCAFDPRKMSDAQKEELFGNVYGAIQLTCGGDDMDQSCVYDPCFEGDLHDCRSGCTKTCASCDDTCTSNCFACKANCTDDVCRNACAPKCAECKESCVTAHDRCRSGTCGQVYGDCRKRLDATWKSQNCNAVCAQYSPCRTGCFEKQERSNDDNFDLSGCLGKCTPATKTSCDLGLCSGKYSMGIEMK